MRRALPPTVLWALSALAAVVLAWQGVGLVTRNVTSSRPDAVGATALREQLASDTTSTTERAESPEPSTAGPVGGSGPAGDDGTPDQGPGDVAVTTVPAGSGVPTTTAAAPAAVTRTYNLVGGTVALRFTPAGVTVEYATPNAGFDVKVEPEHGNGVKVEFESDDHRSRVDGWWSGGPQDRVREEPS